MLYEEGKRKRKDDLAEGIDTDSDPAVILERREYEQELDEVRTLFGDALRMAYDQAGLKMPAYFEEPEDPPEPEPDPFEILLEGIPKVYGS